MGLLTIVVGTLTKKRTLPAGGLETRFDATFASALALREKQIQQNYRPIIGIHKWFARRPGTLFRALILAEFCETPVRDAYWQPHGLLGTIADPFMGGGTSLYEASRLGFSVLGCDINPMSYWLVHRAFASLDLDVFAARAAAIERKVRDQVGHLFVTRCSCCGGSANVKYFLWVKTADCPHCHETNDLFPGCLLAENVRHPRNVLTCLACGELNECASVPSRETPARCTRCNADVHKEGTVRRGKCACRSCGKSFAAPGQNAKIPRHRMWAIEYNCAACYSGLEGRQFKSPDADDLARYEDATKRLKRVENTLKLPDDTIPSGDETDRLHRWGYKKYREMFGARQLLTLGLLRQTILEEADGEVRNALLTVFSDILRYNNMLCRYDTYALKCQDIFSVHGFPVGLVQCENNVLGIPSVGSGGFNHFIEKYQRAKRFCLSPFEVRSARGKKEFIPIAGETIGASDAATVGSTSKTVDLRCEPAQSIPIAPESLDAVFTDPPYFANVQYAELIDFCYVWLRGSESALNAVFAESTTRSVHEATGNTTQGRGIEQYTTALSAVFVRFAQGLKPNAPFVFTYHHNDPTAYAPLIVATLDAGLSCSEVLPAAAEMSASLHIAGTNSSVLDSVFVCRKAKSKPAKKASATFPLFGLWNDFAERLLTDTKKMAEAGVKIGIGDVRCLGSGLVAKLAASELATGWQGNLETSAKLRGAEQAIAAASKAVCFDDAVASVFDAVGTRRPSLENHESDYATPL